MSSYMYKSFKAVPCQADSDDAEELLLAAGENVYLFNVNLSASTIFSLLDSVTMLDKVTGIAAGDMSGDGIDEFALGTLAGTFTLFTGGNFNTPLTNPADYEISGAGGVEPAMGDFDGDRLCELALGFCISDGTVNIFWYNYDGNTFEKTKSNIDIATSSIGVIPFFKVLSPVVLDIDGDGEDELFCYNMIRDYSESLNVAKSLSTSLLSNYIVPQAAVGDINQDGKEDLILLHIDTLNSNATNCSAWWYNSTGNPEFEFFYEEKPVSDINAVTITSGNIDEDSPLVEFLGHEMEFTDPVVLAVLASPPYYADVAADTSVVYDYTNWETFYETSESSSTTNSATVGVSAGVTVEVEQEIGVFGINFAQVKASASFTASIDWRMDLSHEVSYAEKYSCRGGENRVAFTTIPMDVYSYQLYETADREGDDAVFTIAVPRPLNVYFVEQDFYNGSNGILPDVGSDILCHTIGDLNSYMTASDKSTIVNGNNKSVYSDCRPVCQSSDSPSGDRVLTITMTDTEAYSISGDLAVDASVGAGVGGVTLLANVGFHTGYSYTNTMSSGEAFGGTVGYLPTSYYLDANYFYSAGLLAWQYEQSGTGHKFWVISYWIE